MVVTFHFILFFSFVSYFGSHAYSPWTYQGILPRPLEKHWPDIQVDPFPPSQSDYDALRYEFSINLTDDSDSIQVLERGIILWLNSNPATFILDLTTKFRVSSLLLDGRPLIFLHRDDKIVVCLLSYDLRIFFAFKCIMHIN